MPKWIEFCPHCKTEWAEYNEPPWFTGPPEEGWQERNRNIAICPKCSKSKKKVEKVKEIDKCSECGADATHFTTDVLTVLKKPVAMKFPGETRFGCDTHQQRSIQYFCSERIPVGG